MLVSILFPLMYTTAVLQGAEERWVQRRSLAPFLFFDSSRFPFFFFFICVQSTVMKAVQCASFVPKCNVEAHLFNSVLQISNRACS